MLQRAMLARGASIDENVRMISDVHVAYSSQNVYGGRARRSRFLDPEGSLRPTTVVLLVVVLVLGVVTRFRKMPNLRLC